MSEADATHSCSGLESSEFSGALSCLPLWSGAADERVPPDGWLDLCACPFLFFPARRLQLRRRRRIVGEADALLCAGLVAGFAFGLAAGFAVGLASGCAAGLRLRLRMCSCVLSQGMAG